MLVFYQKSFFFFSLIVLFYFYFVAVYGNNHKIPITNTLHIVDPQLEESVPVFQGFFLCVSWSIYFSSFSSVSFSFFFSLSHSFYFHIVMDIDGKVSNLDDINDVILFLIIWSFLFCFIVFFFSLVVKRLYCWDVYDHDEIVHHGYHFLWCPKTSKFIISF